MKDKQRPEYLFVVNHSSGRNGSADKEEKINAFLSANNIVGAVYHLPEKFNLQQIKDHVLSASPKKVIAVGGDGTVTMLANIIAATDITLGILPGGSANGMAKELDIPEDADEALEIIGRGNTKPVDLILINNKTYCLHLSDIGLNAHLIKHFDEGKLRGKLGYALVILKTLWQQTRMHVLIDTGKQKIRRSAFMVALANARKYGTGAVINPNGKPDDGAFEVIIIRRLSFASLLKMIFRPGIFNPKKIEIITCSAAEITTSRKVHFQIDGEYSGKTTKVSAVIKPGIIRMITP